MLSRPRAAAAAAAAPLPGHGGMHLVVVMVVVGVVMVVVVVRRTVLAATEHSRVSVRPASVLAVGRSVRLPVLGAVDHLLPAGGGGGGTGRVSRSGKWEQPARPPPALDDVTTPHGVFQAGESKQGLMH